MEVIICDRRHARVEILREDTIEKRRFENWSFGILPASARVEGKGPSEAFIRSLATRLG